MGKDSSVSARAIRWDERRESKHHTLTVRNRRSMKRRGVILEG